MIDKEYIKEIISRITNLKAEKNMVPATASMQEIMTAVREDALECMRTMCNDKEIVGEQNVEQCFIQVPMRRHHNPNKVPPFKPDPEHWTRKVHSWKAKVAYETEDDAWEFLNQIPRLKALGWHPYLCKVCSKWHIGRLHNK
jgi:hypothetical protein